MIRQRYLRLLSLIVILTSSVVVLAGSLHFVGSTKWGLGSLLVNGSVVGLASSGVPQGTVRLVGYGYCDTASGHWQPSDMDQLDNDPDKTDDYPETRLILPAGTNKIDFTMKLPNPGTSGSNVDVNCTPGTWVWTGATLQLWSSNGSTLITLFAQKGFQCYPKTGGGFDCR